MYSSSQPLHTAHHKICPVFILIATPQCSAQNMPCNVPQSPYNKICHVFILTATPQCSAQNMPCIFPHSHSTLLTTKYAMYSSSQPLHNALHKICHVMFLSHTTLLSISPYNKICHVFILTATPPCSAQNMPRIFPYSHSTLLTTKYAMYSSPQPLHTAHHKICHVFFLTATPHCSPQNMPCNPPHSHKTLLSISAYNKICHTFFRTATPHSSPQNMQHILPHSHSTLLTTKYAM